MSETNPISERYPLTPKRERFCQLMAQDLYQGVAYAEAYNHGYLTHEQKRAAIEGASALMRETPIKLRIQELRAPVIRKVRRKIEYGLQRALEQCDLAFDLATEAGDAKTILKAVEMQAKLAKLLSEEINVTHRHGLLDDASTEVLLLMRKEAEVRRARQNKLIQINPIESEIHSQTPQAPPADSEERVPSGKVLPALYSENKKK